MDSNQGKIMTVYPKNKVQFKKLITFCNEILGVCKGLGITAIAYGSFAYFLYTKDPEVKVNDIDLLVPRKSLKRIDRALTERKIRHKLIKLETLKAFKNGVRIEIDPYEFSWWKLDFEDSKYIRFDDLKIKIISLKNLKKIYGMAVKESKTKTEEYQSKYEELSKWSST
jgi:hypothetical protein